MKEQSNHLLSGFHFRGSLPHLKREGSAYFVTFRQSGSLPKSVLIRLKRERERLLHDALAAKRPLTWQEQEGLFRWYSTKVDAYLDAGHGTCYLRDPACARIVADAIGFFENQRYHVHSWVVMPNHVHVVVRPMPGHLLSHVLHSWKSYSAHEINRILHQRITPFWQKESYEHCIRGDADLSRCCRYTIMNPVTAGLCERPEDWRWSSAYIAHDSPMK